MANVNFRQLWNSHPGRSSPCDKIQYRNQCAIRMGVALYGAGVTLATFVGERCWLGHQPKHILRAQELAKWMIGQTATFGAVQKHLTEVSSAEFVGKTGIVFIKDGWGSTDHIDLWNGSRLMGGEPSYFARGKEVWFWTLK